jgi:hypothetical protein
MSGEWTDGDRRGCMDVNRFHRRRGGKSLPLPRILQEKNRCKIRKNFRLKWKMREKVYEKLNILSRSFSLKKWIVPGAKKNGLFP